MDNYKFAIIKIKKDTPICKTTEDVFNDSNERKPYYYNNIPEEYLEELHSTKHALFLYYSYNTIYKIAFCGCYINSQNSLACTLSYLSTSEIIIHNISDCLFLDLKNDFSADYITIETSKKLFEHFICLTKYKHVYIKNSKEYSRFETDKLLHNLAQKNHYCLREYNLKDPTSDNRSEFQRDYDRIIYSKSFRRMVDKTQVFSSSKGDHYRTRMTHSQIVCQIARSICQALNLNQPLTEAIAIGHDLGHTPFGHVGERTLNDILKERFIDVGGFKHNYQGLRIVSKLEKHYFEIDGLDLSYQVIEGIFKHTKQKDEVKIDEFVSDPELIEYLHLNYKHSITLEGQIVCIADEIAQRSHDIDDAFASKLLTFKEFLSYLELNKFEKLKHEIELIKERRDRSYHFHDIIPDENELFAFQISSAIVKFFIGDVITASKDSLEDYNNIHGDSFNSDNSDHIITDKLIHFSERGELICLYLEKLLSNKVLNSPEVSFSDKNSEEIIRVLFNAYYQNPQLLHSGTKRKIYNDFVEHKYPDGPIKDIIDLENSSPKVIREEFSKITQISPQDDEYKAKKKILVRDICDYISGMTDSYAIEEYKKISNSSYV